MAPPPPVAAAPPGVATVVGVVLLAAVCAARWRADSTELPLATAADDDAMPCLPAVVVEAEEVEVVVVPPRAALTLPVLMLPAEPWRVRPLTEEPLVLLLDLGTLPGLVLSDRKPAVALALLELPICPGAPALLLSC